MSDDLHEPQFGSSEPWSLGVEEELFLVDPGDGSQRDAREEVLAAVGEPDRGEITGELQACLVELITDVCATPADAVSVLSDLRECVRGTGIGLLGTSTHPTAPEGVSEISDTERYEFVARQIGDAVASPVAAVHVHVGVADPPTAIRVFNGLRRHLPLIEALAANSPFRHDRDSGFASARALSLRSWPRAGAPRAFSDWADFVGFAERVTRAAGVPDYTYHYWKLRPHPRLGTVEVRALDVQASLTATASLVAFVQTLARHASQTEPQPAVPDEILEENSVRATRDGLSAELADIDGVLTPVRELIEQTVEVVLPHAAHLGCEAELAGVSKIIDCDGGAGQQRRDHERGGMSAVLDGLLSRSGSHACRESDNG